MASIFALAYIDPGTGSFLLQLMLAGLLGGLASIRIFWSRIRLFVRRRSSWHDQAGE